MALLEEALVAALQADAAVTTHTGIGSPPIGRWRIYPAPLPQGLELGASEGAISYQRIAGGPVNSMGGADVLIHGRVQVDCWAKTYALAKQLAKAARDALDGAGNGLKAVIENEIDFYESDPREHRVSIDFSIWYQESRP